MVFEIVLIVFDLNMINVVLRIDNNIIIIVKVSINVNDIIINIL